MIALRNMFVLTILVLSILGSTFARVYLLDGSTDQSSSITPESSALIQPKLNTSIFLVNQTTTQPTTTSKPPQNHPLNATNARQIDFDNPVYYQEDPVQTDQLSYNGSNFTYGNLNLRRASHSNGHMPSQQDRAATKTAVVTTNGYVPISRHAGMNELQIAHLMNSGMKLHHREHTENRRQHPSSVVRQNGPHLRGSIYAKPPNGYSNRHKMSAQIKQVPTPTVGYPYQVPANLSKNYYETSRRPSHGQMAYKPQKRQPLMPGAERFRPSRPVNTIPIGVDPHLYLKTNISTAYQRQFDKSAPAGAFKPPIGLIHSVQQPSFGQDIKATGDESLEHYQTIGANLGANLAPTLSASPKRIYRPAPLTGPFYTYPNIMQRPKDSKILPSQIFTPGRTPNFAHGNLGDRYPLRQHPQVISTSLKNNNPISQPPSSLQNINFQHAGQLPALHIQPELTPQYATSFPTLSQQTKQYDQHIVSFVPSQQGQSPSPSSSRYPFQPTLQPATPTRISSSLLNAGHGLSGQNIYQQDGTPTIYKVHGTYSEVAAKPKQPPMKPSVQFDEENSSGLSAILNANYRQQEQPSRFKPEEVEIRFKPEDPGTRFKPDEVYRYKTNEQSSRYKPQEDETKYKTEESSYDFKPAGTDSSKYKASNRPSLPGPPYDDDEEIQSKYTPQKPIHEQEEEFTYQEAPSSYDAPLNPKHSYNDYKDADDADVKSPSYPPYPPSKETSPGSVQDILAGSSGRIPSTSYGVPDTSLHGNSYDPHGGGHKKGGRVHTFVKTTKEGHFKWGVRHSATAR